MSTTTANLGLFKYNPLTDGSSTFDLTQAINGPLDKIDAVLPISFISRQSIINGGFSINQRGVSGTVTLAAGQYGHDRWKAGSAGCTYTFTTSNNVTTITISAGSLLQVIEGIYLYSGTYSLSWSGSSQGKIGAGSYGSSGITATVVGGTNLNVEFNVGTLSKVQFNVGDAALPFQPRGFSDELQLCQRYYEKSYSYGVAAGQLDTAGNFVFSAPVGLAASTAGAYRIGFIGYKVRKGTLPTVKIYSSEGTANAVRINETNTTIRTGVSAANAGETGFSAITVDATSTTAITTGQFIDFQWTSDAEI